MVVVQPAFAPALLEDAVILEPPEKRRPRTDAARKVWLTNDADRSWLLTLMVVALLACGPLPRHVPPAWRPDLFVILVAFAALRAPAGRETDALVLCWLTGLAKDLLSAGPVGQYALLCLAAGRGHRAPAAGPGCALGGDRGGAGLRGGVRDGNASPRGPRARRRPAVARARRFPRAC